MSTSLKADLPILPMKAAPQFFTHDYRRILSEVCTPLTEAVSNEIVGIVVDAQITPGGCHIDGAKQLVRAHMEDDTTSSYRMTGFNLLSEDEKRDFAFACMSAQTGDLFDSEEIFRIYGNMVSTISGTQDVSVFLLPDVAFIASSDLFMKVYAQQDRQGFQGLIDRNLAVVLPKVPETAHEALENLSTYKPFLRFANSFWMACQKSPQENYIKLRLKIW